MHFLSSGERKGSQPKPEAMMKFGTFNVSQTFSISNMGLGKPLSVRTAGISGIVP